MLTITSPLSRTVMAASRLARSKGVTGVTTTSVCFFLLTLLCLVSLSGSLIDKGQLEELRENVQKLQQEALRRKAENKLDRTYVPELLQAVPHVMDSLSELLKKDFAPLLKIPMLDTTDDIKTFLKEVGKYADKYLETTAAEIKDYEEKLSGVMERLIHLEEHKDEL